MSFPARGRATMVVLVGVASILSGSVLAFRLVTPDLVGRLSTVELLGLLGLIALPIATWCSGVLGTRMAARHISRLAAARGAIDAPETMQRPARITSEPERASRSLARHQTAPARSCSIEPTATLARAA